MSRRPARPRSARQGSHRGGGAARAHLGLTLDELPDDTRVARSGTEHDSLTEDDVIGRLTVELDPDADGVLRVISVVLELQRGPVTVTARRPDRRES